MNLQKEQLRLIYETHGVVFRDGKIILDIAPSVTLAVDEDIFLEPTEEGISSLKDIISKEIDIEWDLFDIARNACKQIQYLYPDSVKT